MSRIESADVFRVLAIVAVVALHTAIYTGTRAVGQQFDTATVLNNFERFAVPTFFILSGYFWAAKCRTSQDFLGRSFSMSKRVALIFAFWSFIYLIAPVGDAFQTYGLTGPAKQFYWTLTSSPGGFARSLLEGPKVHLWFLPGLISVTLISAVLLAWDMKRTLLGLAVALFLVGLAGGAYANTPLGFHSTFIFRNGPFFGLLFFVTGYALQSRGNQKAWLPIGLALTLSGFLLQLLEVHWLHKSYGAGMSQDFVVSTFPFGVGMALISLSNAPALRVKKLASIGRLVLGIYASHYLFVDLLRPVDNRYHGQVAWDIAYVALVFALSLGATYALSKFSLTRRFVTQDTAPKQVGRMEVDAARAATSRS